MPVLYPDFFFFLQSILIGYLTGWLYFNSCSEKTNSYLAFYLSCLIVTACFSEGNIRVLWQRKMEKYISYLLTDYKVTLELCSMCYNLLCTKAYFDTSSIPVFCDPLSKLSFWHFVLNHSCIQKGHWLITCYSFWGSLRIISPCLHVKISLEL